jgi:uncharacterized protein (DUF2249 family)/quercetin dioxygenase-like cupin family protein
MFQARFSESRSIPPLATICAVITAESKDLRRRRAAFAAIMASVRWNLRGLRSNGRNAAGTGADRQMIKQKLNDAIEFDEKKFLARVLVNQPGYRMILLTFRSGQAMPEHSAREMVTVYVISGHITFYEGQTPTEMRAGEVIWIQAGAPHRVDAHENSSLLVIRAGAGSASEEEEIDLRNVPRPERHPLVFRRFDGLPVGDAFLLVNDHDPVPLNRQLEDMRPGQLSWEYVVRGPELFRIRVRRIAPLTGSEKSLIAGNMVAGIKPS